tara:strand:- start:1540 stop:1704 length:165 start_codon:yes stop_codon:yes gene_type:complete
MRKFLIFLVVGWLFLDDSQAVRNRQIRRLNSAQIEEAILTINHLNSPIHFAIEG